MLKHLPIREVSLASAGAAVRNDHTDGAADSLGVSSLVQTMEPQRVVNKHLDDSLPPGLLITLIPITDREAQRIRMLPGQQITGREFSLGSLEHLGQVVVTPAARAALRDFDWTLALKYHLRGESETATPDDPTLHFRDALRGRPVLAAYRSSLARTFWLVTQADRSRTTILIPDEATSSGGPEDF